MTSIQITRSKALAIIGIAIFSICYLYAGPRLSVISTGSMKPYLSPGDFVLSVSPRVTEPTIGDVIIIRPFFFDRDLPNVAHRLIGEGHDGLETKGDANPKPDPWRTSHDRVDGVVITKVPFAWARMQFLNPAVLAALAAMTALLFLWPRGRRVVIQKTD